MSTKNPIKWIKREDSFINKDFHVVKLEYRGPGLPYIITAPRKTSWWRKLWIASFLSGCASVPQAGPSYYERCGAAQWEYRFNVERTSDDSAMENSGRRNCLRFSGPDACLTRMEKLSNVDYRATCSTERKIMLKGNE